MNFINKLLLWQKFFLIGLLVFTLSGIPFYLYFSEAAKAINFASIEHKGVKPLRLVIKLYKSVQDNRGLAEQVLSGVSGVMDKQAAKQVEINKQISLITNLAQSERWYGEIDQQWQAIKTELRLIATSIARRSVTALETRLQHHQIIEKINILRETVADYYKLSLDPERLSFYITKGLVYDVIVLNDAIGLIRGTGADVLFRASKIPSGQIASNDITDDERTKLIRWLSTLEKGLNNFTHTINNATAETPELQKSIADALQKINSATETLIKLTNNEILNAKTVTYNFSEFRKLASDAVDMINTFNNVLIDELDQILQQRITTLKQTRVLVSTLMLMGALLGAFISYLIMNSILQPVTNMLDTIRQLNQGKINARANIYGPDELGRLATEFNRMVDERQGITARVSEENTNLNDSVIQLLHAVASLSQRDLTVRIHTADNITAPLSDALNMLVMEMAATLKRISDISNDVNLAAISVQEQADLVSSVAKSEREQVEKTATELDSTALTMLRIAKLAQATSITAEKATQTTLTALTTVKATVDGIEIARNTVREAGAKIERLGIHSQEISGVVELISGIARRTQILAVSASMHAASAGEAGHGFQVIANEVQRLAETAQQAAAKIGSLLENIRGEVADTVTMMNGVVKQVIEGSKLAEQAGEQMRLTQRTTADLVNSVMIISESSEEQAQSSAELLNRANSIRKSTQITNKQLQSQAVQTTNLVKYAKNLLTVVQVFKLPESQ